MAIPPLIGNPYNGPINPYYWVDEFIPYAYYMEIMGVDRPWAHLIISYPYNGLLKSLYNWLVSHPLYNPTNQGPFFRGSFACHIVVEKW